MLLVASAVLIDFYYICPIYGQTIMKKIFCLIAAVFCFACISYGQKVLTRTGSYTYVAPPDQSLEIAKQTALERAKLQIIEDEFGTEVGVSNISRTANVDGKSSSSFLSIGGTEVRGEWIRTIGAPIFDMSFNGESMLVVKVTVKGEIREIKSSSIDLEVKILRNGVDEKDETDVLRDNDGLFVLFRSPVKGFVAVYQYDSDGVFRLLPYKEAENAAIPVKAGKRYVFFSESARQGVALRDELPVDSHSGSHYLITCNSAEDLCRYYIIFSPNSFTLPNDEPVDDSIPAKIDFDSFQKWLARARKYDRQMTVAPRDVLLKKIDSF